MNRKACTVLVIVLVLVLLLAATVGLIWFNRNFALVEWHVYPRNAEFLNLRGKEITVEHYEAIRERFPDCEIYWNVPFQGGHYPEDTTQITVTSLTDEDVAVLGYLTQLKTVHAENCEDYAQLAKLQQSKPNCEVCYTVTIGGKEYPQDAKSATVASLSDAEVELFDYLPQLASVDAMGCKDYDQLLRLRERHPDCEIRYSVPVAGEEYDTDVTEMTLTEPDVEELTELLRHFPKMETVHLVDPDADAQELVRLREACPEAEITWELELFGVRVSSLAEEVDLSGSTVKTLADVEKAMAYFPEMKQVFLGLCGIDNEELAQFREEKREEYKVVWQVECGKLYPRTDDTYFMPVKYHVYYCNDSEAYNLRYCEDMVCIDLGHMAITNVEWAAYMPHLKYLILAHSQVRSIAPLESCKELVFLELDWTSITDYSPLAGCTALEDLNLGLTYGDATPITQMTWLKNLWWKDRGYETRVMLEEALPDTRLEFAMSYTVGNGWRKLQNYYDMRDLLGMEYMD